MVLASLAGVIAIAWVYLLLGAGIEMDEMDMGGHGTALDTRLCGADLRDVVDHDGSDDASERGAHHPAGVWARAQSRHRPRRTDGGSVHLRVCPGLGRLQHRRDIAAVEPRPSWLAFGGDGSHEYDGRRFGTDRSGHLPVDTVEAAVSEALPFATSVPAATLAQGSLGRRDQWCSTRHFLPRLLLDADVDAVRWWVDELALDWRDAYGGTRTST